MFDFDPSIYPYPSRRNCIFAEKGMVATGQPLAAQAGLEMLKKGGNAIDAAIATAACLTVVEPPANGIGGDAFCIGWVNGQLIGLNASGPSPQGLTIDKLKEQGLTEMPDIGWGPVTVPGVPAAWAELSRKFGKLSLIEVLGPAIAYAQEGYPVSPGVASNWSKRLRYYDRHAKGEQFKFWYDTFAPNGRTPRPGEVWRSPDHARTLQSIGESYADSFYLGEIAEKIDAFSRSYGGYIRKEDLSQYSVDWVSPISVDYRGYRIWELPPNGQGIIALQALNILKGYDFVHRELIDTYHKQIEAIKLAFTDGMAYIADPDHMQTTVEQLLSEEYAEKRRQTIQSEAVVPKAGEIIPPGGTVYLATADLDGNMVSYIQSNYDGFGSGLVVPGTGIALQNRGHCFSFDPEHVNCLEPGKRSYHTIIPGFLTKDNVPVGPFGVMGGFIQPQAHVQVLMNAIDFGMNPQAALDAPRWKWLEKRSVQVECHFPEHLANQLVHRGHDISMVLDHSGFGRGQIIWRNSDGVLCAGTEGRTDGSIAAW
ncbi:MAG TPA: gamma-glutamyltransferase family protein [bacterium]|nr:gamma-glutamyltransferase family protein [bacterium]